MISVQESYVSCFIPEQTLKLRHGKLTNYTFRFAVLWFSFDFDYKLSILREVSNFICHYKQFLYVIEHIKLIIFVNLQTCRSSTSVAMGVTGFVGILSSHNFKYTQTSCGVKFATIVSMSCSV